MTPDRPSSARITNYWLGGYNHTAADREVAAEFERACPQARRMALDSRLFTARVTGWAADRGIGQFLDLGAGMPAGATVHEMARSVRWDATAAYVDNDAEVTDWLTDVMPGGRDAGVAVACADLSEPVAVMSDPSVREVIDPGRPVCVLAALVLHFWTAAEARSIILGYARLLAWGSIIAVSVPRIGDEDAWKRMEAAYPADVSNFTTEQFRGLFGGMDLVPPGIGPARCLRPGWADTVTRASGTAYVLGGIGRVR